MIRPVTCVCLLAATVSGFYLYQTKHRTRMLDRQIEQTMQQAAAVREHSAQLHTEWSLLNDATRLADLAGRHLTLHQVTPGQYVTMADLDHRLPATRVFSPADAAPLVAALPMPAGSLAQGTAPQGSVTQAMAAPAAAAVQIAPASVAQIAPRPAPAQRMAAVAPAPVQPQAAEASPTPPASPAAAPPPRMIAEKPEKPIERPMRDFAARETMPAAKPALSPSPMISQVMATSAPIAAPRPVATRIAAFGQRIASTAATEAVGRIARGETPYSVSSIGSALGAARTALAPPMPVPVPVSSDATAAPRMR